MTGPVESPCRQICRLGEDRVCDGCGRTLGEIAIWSGLAPEGRLTIVRRVTGWVPRGAADQGSGQDQPRSW